MYNTGIQSPINVQPDQALTYDQQQLIMMIFKQHFLYQQQQQQQHQHQPVIYEKQDRADIATVKILMDMYRNSNPKIEPTIASAPAQDNSKLSNLDVNKPVETERKILKPHPKFRAKVPLFCLILKLYYFR